MSQNVGVGHLKKLTNCSKIRSARESFLVSLEYQCQYTVYLNIFSSAYVCMGLDVPVDNTDQRSDIQKA